MLNQEEFLSIVDNNIKIKDKNLLIEAYNFSKLAHKDQKRESGIPYFIHPLEVAVEIAKFKLDEESIITGLLHDVVEDTKYTLEDIKKKFGSKIEYLVNGLTKINVIKDKSRIEKNAENFRKLILSTAKDIRILIIKLIDRLSNMRSINGIKDENRRKRISNETLAIFVPLAERIGMYNLRLELEDLCFKELMPNERQEIINNINKLKNNQENIINNILDILKQKIIQENNIKCEIFGREKQPYSIWKKMKKKSLSFDKLQDIIAFRVITNDLQDCYKVFGVVNSNYVMVPDTFKDYINKPKTNGYQSIHLVVIGPKNIKIEIQIRTKQMDIIAEYGIASHWMYKEDINYYENLNKINYLKELIYNIEENDYNVEKFENLKYEIYEDEIFCYTPKGDIINLPTDSTALDFAFAIHTDIGLKSSGIKINGILSQFKTKLKSGDEIEILTSKTPQVNEEWLNYVKTTKAKSDIKKYIRNQRIKEFEEIGRNDIQELSKNLKINIQDNFLENNLNKFDFYNIKSINDLYTLIGERKIKINDFLNILFPNLNKENKEFTTFNNNSINFDINKNIGIQGLDKNIAFKYCKNCYPIPPDEIVGVINTGIGITIHKKDCQMLKNTEKNRILNFDWNYNQESKYISKLLITTDSKAGILAKIVNICAEKNINIIGITTLNESKSFQEIDLKIEVKNKNELNNLKAMLRSIKGIINLE